jgi:hypothetical protein
MTAPARLATRNRSPVCRRQAGQALTEFLVAALAVVPLFLLIPVIAKYQDISHSAQMASRYAAFDVTVNNPSTQGLKNPEVLAQEVRRRFFSNVDAPIRSNDAAGNFQAHRNLFWRDPAGNALVNDVNAVAVSVAEAGGSRAALLATEAPVFGLTDRPMYRGAVSVPLANLPAGIRSYEPFDRIDLRIDRATTVLVDGWRGRDVATVRARVGRADLAGQALGRVGDVLTLPFAVLELDRVRPPRIGELQRWDDVVPTDRLRPRTP